MKEKNFKRKMELRRRKQKTLLKKGLRNDIAAFLTNYWMLQVRYPIAYVEVLLKEGFRGFDNMRSKHITDHFDEAYKALRNPKEKPTFYYKRTSWSDDSDKKLLGLKETEQEIERLTIESESLMNRLMELAFDLDIDE